MNENPYQSGVAPTTDPKTRPTRWVIWSGVASIVLATLCFVMTIVWMMQAFDRAAAAASADPGMLAAGISQALQSAIVGVCLVFAGVALLVAGFVIRQPSKSAQAGSGL